MPLKYYYGYEAVDWWTLNPVLTAFILKDNQASDSPSTPFKELVSLAHISRSAPSELLHLIDFSCHCLKQHITWRFTFIRVNFDYHEVHLRSSRPLCRYFIGICCINPFQEDHHEARCESHSYSTVWSCGWPQSNGHRGLRRCSKCCRCTDQGSLLMSPWQESIHPGKF